MYEIDIRHDGLNKYRRIRGNNRLIVEQKAEAQKKARGEMWEKKCEIEKAKSDREKAANWKDPKKALAIIKTKEAEKALADIENTLVDIIENDCKINWEELKDHFTFHTPKPTEPYLDKIINGNIQYTEPIQSDARYQPKFNFLHTIIPSLKKRKIAKYAFYFNQEHEQWMQTKEGIIKYKNNIKRWEEKAKKFYEAQKAMNEAIDKQREAYMSQDSDAIIDYNDRVLSKSTYLDSFPQEWELDYISKTKLMIVDYLLPNIDNVPRLKEVKYIQARDEFKEIHLSDSAFNKIYDNLLYNTIMSSALRM